MNHDTPIRNFDLNMPAYLLPLFVTTVVIGASVFPPLHLLGFVAMVFIAALVRCNAAMYVLAFLLPLNPLMEGLLVRDVLSAARIALFLGVLIRKMLLGESLRAWLCENRIDKLLVSYFIVACASATLANHLTV